MDAVEGVTIERSALVRKATIEFQLFEIQLATLTT